MAVNWRNVHSDRANENKTPRRLGHRIAVARDDEIAMCVCVSSNSGSLEPEQSSQSLALCGLTRSTSSVHSNLPRTCADSCELHIAVVLRVA